MEHRLTCADKSEVVDRTICSGTRNFQAWNSTIGIMVPVHGAQIITVGSSLREVQSLMQKSLHRTASGLQPIPLCFETRASAGCRKFRVNEYVGTYDHGHASDS